VATAVRRQVAATATDAVQFLGGILDGGAIL